MFAVLWSVQRWLLRWRVGVAPAVIASVVAATLVRWPRIDTSVVAALRPLDEGFEEYRRSKREFGSPENVLALAMSFDDSSPSPDIPGLARELLDIEAVRVVLEPVEGLHVRGAVRGIDDGSLSYPTGNPLLRSGWALVLIVLAPDVSQAAELRDACLAVESTIERAAARNGASEYHLTGLPLVRSASIAAIEAEVRVLWPAAAAVVLLMLRRVFGSFSALILPTATAVVGLAWLKAPAIWLEPLTLLTVPLAIVVTVMAVVDGVHVSMALMAARERGARSMDDLAAALALGLRPCLLTSCVGVAGFAALGLASSSYGLRQLAALGATCVAVSFCALAVVAPIVAPLLRASRRPRIEAAAARRIVATRSAWLARLCCALVIAGARAFAAAHMPHRATLLEFAPDDDERLARATDLIDARFAALLPFTVTARPAAPETSAGRERRMTELLEVRDALRAEPWTGLVQGPIDCAWASAVGLRAGSRGGADEGHALHVTMRSGTPEELAACLAWVDRRLARANDALGYAAMRLTGETKLVMQAVDELQSVLRVGLLADAALLFLLTACAYRSTGAAIAAVSCNLAPVCAALGILWAVGAHMTPSLVVAAIVSIALVADDTIHVIGALRSGASELTALSDVWCAVLVNTQVVVAGAIVLTISRIEAVRTFGITLTVIVVAATAAEACLWPVLTRLVGPESRHGEGEA